MHFRRQSTAPRGAAAPLFCSTSATFFAGRPSAPDLSFGGGKQILRPAAHLTASAGRATVRAISTGVAGQRRPSRPSSPRFPDSPASAAGRCVRFRSSLLPALAFLVGSGASALVVCLRGDGAPYVAVPVYKNATYVAFSSPRPPAPPYLRHFGRRVGWRFLSGPAPPPSRAGWRGASGRRPIVRITPKQVSRLNRLLPREGAEFINVCVATLAPPRGN